MVISGVIISKVYVMPLTEATDLSFIRSAGGRCSATTHFGSRTE